MSAARPRFDYEEPGMHRANIDWRFSNRHPRKASISRYYQLSDIRSYSGLAEGASAHPRCCRNGLFHVTAGAADQNPADELAGRKAACQHRAFPAKARHLAIFETRLQQRALHVT